jgi:hypothetical protein
MALSHDQTVDSRELCAKHAPRAREAAITCAIPANPAQTDLSCGFVRIPLDENFSSRYPKYHF